MALHAWTGIAPLLPWFTLLAALVSLIIIRISIQIYACTFKLWMFAAQGARNAPQRSLGWIDEFLIGRHHLGLLREEPKFCKCASLGFEVGGRVQSSQRLRKIQRTSITQDLILAYG